MDGSIRRLVAVFACLLAAAGGPSTAASQEAPCDATPFRAFDFWVGTWTVESPEGDRVGRNRIRKAAGGCALLESWTSEEGTTGTSLNYFDPGEERWTQVWVGARGLRLHLRGGMDGTSMVLEGERTVDGRRIRDRITWTPRPDGTVRQGWETSVDGGAWETSWVGIYRRADRP